MCGIAGIYNQQGLPASGEIVARMGDVISHRGPDSDGVWCEGEVALSHRRLAIIDLSPHGHQPMMSTNGRYVISYNGEVYNFRELRVELEAKGYEFHSRTDSEVVLNAFAEWGLDGLNRFNGMFAFAVWDRNTKSLTLARDRYGIKPLYYIKAKNTFIFASEIKAILEHPDVNVQMDEAALVEYLTYQNILSDRTLFKDIKILPPGCAMVIDEKGTRLHNYWDFTFDTSNFNLSKEECIEKLDNLFTQAVNRQLVSDVDVGAYLSGGMDSAAITALSSQQLPYIKTFTCGFDLSSASGIEQTFDERREAEHMSYLFKTEHYEMVLKAGDMERCMPSLGYHIEEPRVGQSYPNYYVSRLASKFGKVVLAGTAGDELFAGYPWRYYPHVNCVNGDSYLKSSYAYWQRLFKGQEHQKLFAPIWENVCDYSTFDVLKSVYKNRDLQSPQTPEDYINHSLYFEAKTFLHGLLVIEDKLSMAHSLETRVPFLDNDLVDFAQTIPASMKLGCLNEVVSHHQSQKSIDKFLAKTKDGKLILREMMRKYVPSEVVEKVKQGFSAPDASWFQGESMEYVREVILNDRARIYDYLDRDFVQGKIQDHLTGKQNHRLMIWSLLSLEQWCQCFM